jgi:hypothetical protein
MEIYSSTTRFALACNISEKIIEPIQSRCAILRYSKLTDQQVKNKKGKVEAALQRKQDLPGPTKKVRRTSEKPFAGRRKAKRRRNAKKSGA